MQKRKTSILCYSEFRAKALVRQTATITSTHIQVETPVIKYKAATECIEFGFFSNLRLDDFCEFLAFALYGSAFLSCRMQALDW